MNTLRRLFRWLTTPRKDDTQEEMRLLAQDAESSRRAHLADLPAQPDLSNDPDTEVPPPHLSQVQHVDLTKPVPRGEQAPVKLTTLQPSDWDLLSPDERALFEQITPHDESKTIRYPAPAEQSTADWVTEQLQKAGYSESYRLRFAGFRRVGVGMSMRHLGDLKCRADARDKSLTVHDLIALRQRGIA